MAVLMQAQAREKSLAVWPSFLLPIPPLHSPPQAWKTAIELTPKG